MTEPRAFLCKSHPDFHIPEDVDVGVGFDADDYGRRLHDCGADAVVFFAKCHYGHSYYHTNVGFRHPRLKSDLLADTIEGCHKHGVGVIGYYSVFLDTAAMRQHPDWQLQATAAKTDAGFDSGNFLPVCVNSPYGDELMIPQCVEVVQRYDVADMFLDTMTGFQPCYCENCRRAFGRPIPESAADPAWMDYVRWYAKRYETFFAKVAAAITGARKGVGVTFNWEWIHRLPGTPVPGITRLAADLTAGGLHGALRDALRGGHGASLRVHDRALPARPGRVEQQHARDAARDGRHDDRQWRRLLADRPPAARRHDGGPRVAGDEGCLLVRAGAARVGSSARATCPRPPFCIPTRASWGRTWSSFPT